MVFISPNSVQSENVLNEIAYALRYHKTRNIMILPIYLEETDLPDELDFTLGRIQAVMSHKMENERFSKKVWEQLSKFKR